MTTNFQPTRMQFAAAFFHALRQCVEIVLRGEFAPGPAQSWTVSQGLKCRKCGTPTVAMLNLATWVEFDKAFKHGDLRCECDGVLADENSLILAP